MKMYRKLSFISMIIIFAAITTGCKSKLTATASGQVTKVVIDRDTKTTKVKNSSGETKRKTKTTTETEINYTYTVAGKTYTG
jgi:predicted kinase